MIEQPIVDHIDMSGWDLRKALQLFRKSNPPLMGWLVSPIVYRECGAVPDALRQMRTSVYSARTATHHYLNMALAEWPGENFGP